MDKELEEAIDSLLELFNKDPKEIEDDCDDKPPRTDNMFFKKIRFVFSRIVGELETSGEAILSLAYMAEYSKEMKLSEITPLLKVLHGNFTLYHNNLVDIINLIFNSELEKIERDTDKNIILFYNLKNNKD